jgi:hypothetical protein
MAGGVYPNAVKTIPGKVLYENTVKHEYALPVVKGAAIFLHMYAALFVMALNLFEKGMDAVFLERGIRKGIDTDETF